MAEWVAVCRLDELREGAGRSLDAAGVAAGRFPDGEPSRGPVGALSAFRRLARATAGSRRAKWSARSITGGSGWPTAAARPSAASACTGSAARSGGMRSGSRSEARLGLLPALGYIEPV